MLGAWRKYISKSSDSGMSAPISARNELKANREYSDDAGQYVTFFDLGMTPVNGRVQSGLYKVYEVARSGKN